MCLRHGKLVAILVYQGGGGRRWYSSRSHHVNIVAWAGRECLSHGKLVSILVYIKVEVDVASRSHHVKYVP